MDQTRPRKPPLRQHASATVSVQDSEAETYEQDGDSALIEVRLKESFTGDIEGESQVRALQIRRNDGCASMVSLQRVRGKLGGRRGAFTLQGLERIDNGRIKASWVVVPGSGTGELAGLRGEGGFDGDFGKGSRASLDYWFE